MKKIVILKPFIMPLATELVDQIKQAAPDYTVFDYTNDQYTVSDLLDAEIILGWAPEVEEALNHPNQIKWIQMWIVGVDKVPLAKIANNGTQLTTAGGANAPGIVQQILGLMLMQARRLGVQLDQQRNKEWQFPENMTEITDKNVLLLGTGKIADSFVKAARGFDLTIQGVNTTGHPTETIKDTYPIDAFTQPLSEADYVINFLPHTSKTNQLLGASFFNTMPEHAIYINYGRGKTTDEEALITALENRKIGGAILDVFREEPLPKDSPLWQMPNVYLTPHSAGQSDYYNERVVQIFIRNLNAYQTQESLENQVNFDREY